MGCDSRPATLGCTQPFATQNRKKEATAVITAFAVFCERTTGLPARARCPRGGSGSVTSQRWNPDNDRKLGIRQSRRWPLQ
ncbi:hypothetical protein OIB37_35810 [Streptomyces sp. NBC_00820]|uniref:hypothetical protein n=1 Tax=Streptomyces sp. NBC_00820 TaxID=2975842 RepID=UPI002ECFF33A|nr:hypothetical protein OIB37_00390 [Streptomyces sp. NBC_00820]WTI18044.1 hypothetical protein OIB37_35810 [Streptomyces sp. NBC_00820]